MIGQTSLSTTYRNIPSTTPTLAGKPPAKSVTFSTNNKTNELQTPEDYAQWREERLQSTGKIELDNNDIDALLEQANKKSGLKLFSESTDLNPAEKAAQAARQTTNNGDDGSGFINLTDNKESASDRSVNTFLKQLPDDYYHALYPATGQLLDADNMQTLMQTYSLLQPMHDNPVAKTLLDQINTELEPYREAYQYGKPDLSRLFGGEDGGDSLANTKEDTPNAGHLNYRFEASLEDFKKEVQEKVHVHSAKGGHEVSGAELLDAIKENTQYKHVASADDKNGVFDPTPDKKSGGGGLFGFIEGIVDGIGDAVEGVGDVIEDVAEGVGDVAEDIGHFAQDALDNPVVRTIAQIAQFTPLAPYATVFNTVAAAHDTVQALEDGNITGALAGIAGAATGMGKITGSASVANTAGTMRNVATAASIINDPKNAALNLVSASVANYVGHGNNGASPFGDAKPIAHAITQGAIEELRGGDFASGAAGALAAELSIPVSEALSIAQTPDAIIQRTALAGIMGGIAAEISGGDFEDGAKASLFTHLFNDELKPRGNTVNLLTVKGGNYPHSALAVSTSEGSILVDPGGAYALYDEELGKRIDLSGDIFTDGWSFDDYIAFHQDDDQSTVNILTRHVSADDAEKLYSYIMQMDRDAGSWSGTPLFCANNVSAILSNSGTQEFEGFSGSLLPNWLEEDFAKWPEK